VRNLVVIGWVLVSFFGSESLAQARTGDGPPSLSGPRLGATYVLTPGPRELEQDYGLEPVLSQFGWQFEHRFFEQPGGYCGLNEFVVLLGGLDQASLVPTASWVLGVRSYGGFEVGAGPVLSVAEMVKGIDEGTFGVGHTASGEERAFSGVGFAAAAGVTLRSGNVNFPLNLVMVRSMDNYRVSLLAGFTLEDVLGE
jgi:hypothetical protein